MLKKCINELLYTIYINSTKKKILRHRTKFTRYITLKTYQCSSIGTRKIPPWSISSWWIPLDQIPPNLTLTQTLTLNQVGIHRGGIDEGGIFRTPAAWPSEKIIQMFIKIQRFLKFRKNMKKIPFGNWYVNILQIISVTI